MNKKRSEIPFEKHINKSGNSRLVLHNDDVNDFAYVIQILEETFSFDEIQSNQLALLAHYKGKITIKEGVETRLLEYQEELDKAGLTTSIEYLV